MRWLDRLLGKQRATGSEPQHEAAVEARRQAGEQSARPDIQAGALRMAEGEEPRKHEHPSYRETAEEREDR
jgi:hypothetical protein